MERHMWQKKKIFCHFYGIGTCGQEGTHENDRVIFLHDGERGEGCRMDPCSICDKAIQVVCHDFATRGECQFKFKHMNKYTLFYHKQEQCKIDCNFCKTSAPSSLISIDDERKLLSKRSFEKKKTEKTDELERLSPPWAIRTFYVNYRDIVKSRLGEEFMLKAFPGKVVMACPGLKTDVATKAFAELWNEFVKFNKTSACEKFSILDGSVQVVVENGLEITDILFQNEFNSIRVELDAEHPADEVKQMLSLDNTNIRYYKPGRTESIKDVVVCYRNKIDAYRALKVIEDKIANSIIPAKAAFPMINPGDGFTAFSLRVKVTLRGSQKLEANSRVGDSLKLKIFKDFGIDESMAKRCQLKPSKKTGALKFYIDCPTENSENIIHILSTQFNGRNVDDGISLQLKFYFAITVWIKNGIYRYLKEKSEMMNKYFTKKSADLYNSWFKYKTSDPNFSEEDSLHCIKMKSGIPMVGKEVYETAKILFEGVTVSVNENKDKFVDKIMKNYFLELQIEDKLAGKIRIVPNDSEKNIKIYCSYDNLTEISKSKILTMAKCYFGQASFTVDMMIYSMASARKSIRAMRSKYNILLDPFRSELLIYGTEKERDEILEILESSKIVKPILEEIKLGVKTSSKCGKCSQDMTVPKRLFLCGHTFCSECLENYLSSNEQLKLKYNKCPNKSCEKKIHYKDITEILVPSQLHHIFMMKLERFLDEYKEFYPRCITENCNAIVNKVKSSVCLKCNTAYCELKTPLHHVHNGDCPVGSVEDLDDEIFKGNKEEILHINDTNLQKVN